MLPKNNRIDQELFAKLLKKGAVLHSPLFSLRITTEDAVIPRVSFVVSKKIAAGAVERNKMKRRGYAAMRDVLKEDPIKLPFTASFFYKKDSQKAKKEQIRSEIEMLLRKARIL